MANTKKYVSLAKLSLYDEKIKKVITDGDKATLDAAKGYADGLAVNYEAAGAVATAQEALQKNIDALASGAVAANTAEIEKLKGDAQTEGSVAKAIADSAATIQASIDAVDGKADQNATDIDTLEGKVAALEAGTYDDTEVRGLISANVDAIDALEEAHATDKTALEGAIALKADKTALDAVSAVANAAVKQTDYDTKVAALEAEDTRIAGLVATEQDRATEAEGKLEDRIETMEAFWTAAQADGTDSNVIDTLKEIQEYIAADETGASEMLASIQKNAKDIADHVATDHDFAAADEALKTELNTEIAKKADKTVVEGIDGRLTTAEGEIDTLQDEMTQAEADIDALQALFGEGEGSVSDQISEAVEAEATRVDGLLDTKVDKVDGKGLSTNDLTNELKANYDAAYAHSQVAHAPADAQANVIESVKVNGTALTITGKAVDISVPTDNAELTNGAGYLVASDIANKADKATTLAGYGIADAYTSAQTDTAIADAMAQFVEVSEEEINALFA